MHEVSSGSGRCAFPEYTRNKRKLSCRASWEAASESTGECTPEVAEQVVFTFPDHAERLHCESELRTNACQQEPPALCHGHLSKL